MVGEMFGSTTTFPTRAVVLLALTAIAVGCARRSEFIGTVRGQDGAAADAPDLAPGPGDGDLAGSDASDPAQALCAPDDPIPAGGSEPTWNCPGQTRCLLVDPTINPALFAGASDDPTPGAAPVVVYPLVGSVHPLNLGPLTVQWTRPAGATQTAFRIHVASKTSSNSYEFFVPYQTFTGFPANRPPEAVAYAIPAQAWRWIGQQNAGAEVVIAVTGLNPATNRAATSSPITIRFSAGAVEGGLFYMAMEPQRTVWRQVFGAAGGPESIVRIPVAGVPGLDCVGCHSLSRDGSRMAFSATYGGDLTVIETSNPATPIPSPTRPTPTDANAVSPALSPDGKFVFARRAVPGGSVDLRDSNTGVVLDTKTTAEMDGRIDYPEWSPTRSEIVASRAEGAIQPDQPSAANDGRIVIIPISLGARPVIGKPTVVASANSNRTYGNPTFSPDGNWIVFVSRPANQSSYRSVATRLHLIKRDAPEIIYDLGRANGPTDSAAGFPKFAPTPFNHCKTFFLTFQSRQDYGLVRVTSQTADTEWPQLWMTSIDLSKIVPGVISDPSSPPLWLPFQDPGNKNLLGVWSAQIACDGTPSSCGAGAVCTAGRCVVGAN
jgi:hypothetical protein